MDGYMNLVCKICRWMVFNALLIIGTSPSIQAADSLAPTTNASIYPHAATPSRTIGFGRVTFQPTVGYSMIPGSFLLNNLSVGITDQIEVGFVPLLVMNNRSDYRVTPFTFKLSYFESESFDFGVSYSVFKMNFHLKSQETTTQYNVNLTIPQWNFVWRLNPKHQFVSSIDYRTAKVTINSTQTENLILGSSVFLDYIHSPGNHLHYSFGVTGTEELWTPPKKGVGVSVTEERRGKFFSSPRIGVHLFDNGERQLLLSSSFY